MPLALKQIGIRQGTPILTVDSASEGTNLFWLFQDRWLSVPDMIPVAGSLVAELDRLYASAVFHNGFPPRLDRPAFDPSEGLVHLKNFAGLTAIQAAVLVSLIMAGDGEAVERFWEDLFESRAKEETGDDDPEAT